jgi:RNA polymerase sigma-54 factor
LDDDGYLRRDLDSIVNDLAFTQGVDVPRSALEESLGVVQTLDPAGVGARDLQECLKLQVIRKRQDKAFDDPRQVALARAALLLDEHYEAFTKKHYDRLQTALEVDEDALRDALEELITLNPKPGNAGSDSSRVVHHVIPDFLLSVDGEDVVLQLNGRNAPELRVSRTYREMMDTYSQGGKQDKATREALTFVKQKVDAAKWFVDAIAQRQHTLTKTMQAIVEHQRAYFLSGDEVDLKPMILKDIADRIGMDISTVSRVANSKYVQTPYGTLSLKSFFSEGISTDSGEEVSSREVKKILQDAIAEEDKRKPLSDEKLGVLLNAKGYNIARRTVAKYREQLGLPVARLRKEL